MDDNNDEDEDEDGPNEPLSQVSPAPHMQAAPTPGGTWRLDRSLI